MSGRGATPRPRKAGGPLFGSLFALGLWEVVAHNSGSGWVQALGCLLAGFVVVGLGGPGLATARLQLVVEANPADATVGQPVHLAVRAARPMRVEPVSPPGAVATGGPGAVTLEIVPPRRGEIDHIEVWLSSAAPFGLVWWRKRTVVALARPMWAAPVPGQPDWALVAGAAADGEVDRTRPKDGRFGEPRGVRPYEAGDPRHLVHWPASAHRGETMVREVERPDATLARLVVTLPDDGAAGDVVAARALGTLLALLWRSSPVQLTTTEAEGHCTRAVYIPADAGRRLARAVADRAVPR